jgi:histidyl-tRNA synthetase
MLVDSLCEGCRAHHDRVLEGLDAAGIAHAPDDRLVRGFDYYTRTTFEFGSDALEGAQNAIGGGGRYDGLVEILGGPATPGIGFGIGIERVLLACDAEEVFDVAPDAPAAFVVDVTDGRAARDLVAELRQRGVFAERAYDGRSMKAQLKAADRSGAPVALLIGSAELAQKSVTIRTLREQREQSTCSVEELLAGIDTTGEITW